jgi:hypothetical protein
MCAVYEGNTLTASGKALSICLSICLYDSSPKQGDGFDEMFVYYDFTL